MKIFFILLTLTMVSCNKNKSVWDEYDVFEAFGLTKDFNTRAKSELKCPNGFTYQVTELLDNVKAKEIFIFKCKNNDTKDVIALTYEPASTLNQVMYIAGGYEESDEKCIKNKEELISSNISKVTKKSEGQHNGSSTWEAYGEFNGFSTKASCGLGFHIYLWKKRN